MAGTDQPVGRCRAWEELKKALSSPQNSMRGNLYLDIKQLDLAISSSYNDTHALFCI
jgi:hypothetical protein